MQRRVRHLLSSGVGRDDQIQDCRSGRVVWNCRRRVRGARRDAPRAQRWPSGDIPSVDMGLWLGCFLQLANWPCYWRRGRCFLALARAKVTQFQETGVGDQCAGSGECRGAGPGRSSCSLGTSTHANHSDWGIRRRRACSSRDAHSEANVLAHASAIVVGRFGAEECRATRLPLSLRAAEALGLSTRCRSRIRNRVYRARCHERLPRCPKTCDKLSGGRK